MKRIDEATTWELEHEIAQRKAKADIAKLEDMKRREIKVYCPNCGGTGQVKIYDQWVGNTEVKCSMCDGDRIITAYRVE